MKLEEYASYDATGLARLVRSGEVSAGELAALAVAGIDKVNPAINAVIEVWPDRTTELDESSLAKGIFTGVPFLLKDLGPKIKGRKQDGGSRLTAGYVADYTHFFTEKMLASGLNIIARTTCPEFGVTGTTESILTGTTRNPWNTDFIAGGSSGGSAAAVAAGIVPMAHSNDGGGSTRLPAAICGNVGLKHSRGRISYYPDGCDLSFPLFSEGVNAHTIRDIANFLDAVNGPAPGEPIIFCQPERPFIEEVSRPPGRLKIAVCAGDWCGYGMEKHVSEEIKRIAKICEDAAHIVEEAVPGIDYELYTKTFRDIWCMDIAAMLDVEAAHMERTISGNTLEPMTLKMYREGCRATAGERLGVSFDMHHITRILGVFFENYDVLLTPVLSRSTPQIGSRFNTLHKDQTLDDWFDNALSLIPYTPINNLSGTPAITLPMGMDENGLPLGAHFMAPVGREDRLLNLAGQLEQLAPWIDKKPGIHVTE